MRVLRRYMHNSLRNFNYLLACEHSHQAIALDPLDGEAMVALAQQHGLQIKLIINTHEHHDHIEGNPAVQAATGAPVWAHENARIPNQAHGIKAGDWIELGTMRLQALHTPGHTPVHVCLLAPASEYDAVPRLFSGDTLFNACAGNCKNGGNVDDMYESFVSQLMPLPDETLLYPGHDYMKNNLGFALDREPGNAMASYWQQQVAATPEDDMPLMTLGQERQYNPFLRLHTPEVIAGLRQQFPDLSADDRAVFKALRQLRDHW
ncbi:hydroxyacylglutathione hydrolase [Bacterioplanes sanyensis]|uniref:hydroxyacylglutathione hydrolase n=1 Tax=Bacterioplanes sanyensis TaxID=1249553 RepID=A0A222FLA4_9GAMM|nr:hydroxyacylglutathione hydrolase [Bacterioplanes sanyensis]ASP39560.1 hydroxyacylglutathione hydrolase [Bacterioplanes sanyensis]